MFKYVDKKCLSFHATHQEVSRCHTKGESEESSAHAQRKMQVGGFTMALKPEVQDSGPTKRTDVLQKFF